MKPYYVLACVGSVDTTGAPERFGVLGADSPAEAENLVRQVAGMHREKGENVDLCILQSYRAYPSHLLNEIFTAEETLKRLKERQERSAREDNAIERKLRALGEENRELKREKAQENREKKRVARKELIEKNRTFGRTRKKKV
jgi:hypothetical protein